MKKLVWDLADEVYDRGDALLIRRGGEEEVVRLSNIVNVSMTYMSPPRITLRLAKAGKFGGEIAFSPGGGSLLNPLAKNEIAEDLILRVDEARSQRAV